MPELNSLEPLLLDELRDLLDAEKQLTRVLPKLAKAASTPDLRSALEDHLEQTKGHIDRLDEVFALLGAPARGKKCVGIQGLIEEGDKKVEEAEEGAVRDAALIGSAQKAEHYEIASYGTLRTYANLLGYNDAARLLEQTLEEEKAADTKLTSIAEGLVNPMAAEQEEPEEVGTAGSAGRHTRRMHAADRRRKAAGVGRRQTQKAGRRSTGRKRS